MPTGIKAVWNHIISQKQSQKQYLDRSHNVRANVPAKPWAGSTLPIPSRLWLIHFQHYCWHSPNPMKLHHQGSSKNYHKTKEHVPPTQQDIITRKSTHDHVLQEYPKPSCISKCRPYIRAKLQLLNRSPRKCITQPLTSHISRSKWYHTPWPSPTALSSTPTVMVDCNLIHLAALMTSCPPDTLAQWSINHMLAHHWH